MSVSLYCLFLRFRELIWVLSVPNKALFMKKNTQYLLAVDSPNLICKHAIFVQVCILKNELNIRVIMKTAADRRILQKFCEVSCEFLHINIGNESLPWRVLRVGVYCIGYITHPNTSFRVWSPMVYCPEKINKSKPLRMPIAKLLLLLVCSGFFYQKINKQTKQNRYLWISSGSLFYWIQNYIPVFLTVNYPGIMFSVHHLVRGKVFL